MNALNTTHRTADEIIGHVLSVRGLAPGETPVPSLRSMPSPGLFSQMDRACSILLDALDNDTPVLIVGDYDCDGATATAIAIRGLRMLGFARVDFCVPNRLVHGYALGVLLMDDVILRRRERPGLIITVDNGIAAHAGIDRAKACGMQVIVTDHHLPGPTLPGADAIINPNVQGEAFPTGALCGAGVMFYLLLALRSRMRAEQRFQPGLMPEPDLSELFDLVALGTVADVVPLDGLNRSMVAAGLRQIQSGHAHAGIKALFVVSRRESDHATASDLGFSIGPRVNAAGRLEDMGIGIRCLLDDDYTSAMAIAKQLEDVNQRRKQLQESMVDQAQALLDQTLATFQVDLQAGNPLAGNSGDAAQPLPIVHVMHDTRWHEGVVGLVASRIREATHRPVFAFASAASAHAEAGAPLMLRGSGRSIPGVHLRDMLAEIDAHHPGMIQRFGGHAMAAGLSMEARHLDAFRAAFMAVVKKHVDPAALDEVTLTDGVIHGAEITTALASALDAMPWGQGFPAPLFELSGEVIDWKPIGDKKQYWSMTLMVDQVLHRAVCFSAWADQPPTRISAVARIGVNHYRGKSEVNIVLEMPKGRIEKR